MSTKVFLFPKEFFMVPESEEEMDASLAPAAVESEKSSQFSTPVTLLIKQPHSHNHHHQLTDFTGVWKEPAALLIESVLVCRGRKGINKKTQHQFG